MRLTYKYIKIIALEETLIKVKKKNLEYCFEIKNLKFQEILLFIIHHKIWFW